MVGAYTGRLFALENAFLYLLQIIFSEFFFCFFFSIDHIHHCTMLFMDSITEQTIII